MNDYWSHHLFSNGSTMTSQAACRSAGCRGMPRTPWLAAWLCLFLATPASADERLQGVPGDLADLSIEELANIQVMSVSKRPERLQDAAAAVFVITRDDIRRSGAATLPEALRLAPNLHVAQVHNYGYTISARGLNGSSNSVSNKLLVMIDGRSVYTPLFSGVFWDAQDVLMEDVERIEVISGPGGVMWGANAVNGVINITTRAARDTQGGLLALRGASNGGDVAFRQGGQAGPWAWRAYGKIADRSRSELGSGAPVEDAVRRSQAGFRADWEQGRDRVSVIGNVYRGRLGQPEPGEISISGFDPVLGQVRSDGVNLSARWEHALGDGGALLVQGYLDHTLREVPPVFEERLTLADLQFQHTLPQRGAHQLVWGANYRRGRDRVENGEIIAFLPAHTSQQWASVFLQDDIALRDDWRLTLGGRAEYNDYTGVEFLPSMRLSWRLSPRHAFWAAASRTVRAPSRLDVDVFAPGRPPFLLRGGAAVRAEVARVYELGYRGQPASSLSYSVTLFHHDYDHLRTQEIDPTRSFLTFGSLMEGHSTGIEAWGSWQAAQGWRLSAGWTALHQELHLKPGSNDAQSPLNVGKDPRHTFQLRSSHAFDGGRELEFTVRKVGALSAPEVPAYTALDARFGWRIRPNLELSVVGQNLNGSHAEYGPAAFRAELERRLAVKAVWEY
ncbi:TonB-dependent receptor plug domain-containing protein [Massilia niastensis]|uniref:TonB-dependent receptor plug domain-containing protein n=1 Tax=Massilia niastensis TaxID=544911 RepID=UPI0003A6A778|nr:TonB-dependent receptor [Massilia niastensis]